MPLKFGRLTQAVTLGILLTASLFTAALGVYALLTAPTLFFESEIVTDRTRFQITKLGEQEINPAHLWKLPAFTSRAAENAWWTAQRELNDELSNTQSTVIEFKTDPQTSWQLVTEVGFMPLRDVIARLGMIYLVAMIYATTAISIFRRHPTPEGFVAALFLMSTALYSLSLAPILHRPMVLDESLLRFLIDLFFVSSTGQVAIVHFSLLFPKKKWILQRYPWIPCLFYGYAFVVSALYLTGTIALATTLPFLLFWMIMMFAAFAHSLIEEQDPFMKRQVRITFMAPLLVAVFFSVAVLLPWALEGLFSFQLPWIVGGKLFDNFSLFSLILPFAMALSLDNQYLYRQRLRTEYESRLDKERIHRELHDTVLNDLASILIASEGAQRALGTGSPNTSRRLNRIKDVAADTSMKLRNFLWVIDDQQNRWEDMIGLLRKEGDDLLRPLEISFDLQAQLTTLPVPLPSPGIKHSLHKVFREALINIAKHANATHVTAGIETTPTTVRMTITDNGTGFDAAAARTGYGLVNMTRRIDEIGGQVTITTDPGQGTRIVVELPLGS